MKLRELQDKLFKLKGSTSIIFSILLCLLFFFSGCEKDDTLEEIGQNRSTDYYDELVETNEFLLNFGLVMKDNQIDSNLTYLNKYATKVVLFPYNEYDRIMYRSDLVRRIDDGFGVERLPTIIIDYWEGTDVNFCFGVLVNGDYYLLRFENFGFLVYNNQQGDELYEPQIDLKYKY